MKYLQEAVARGPHVVLGCRGARIRGRSRASMSDAIIPAESTGSHQNSEVKRALAGVVSTSMGDHLGSPRVAFPFF